MNLEVSDYIKNQMLNRMAGLVRRVRALDDQGNIVSAGWRSIAWSSANNGFINLSSKIDIPIIEESTVHYLEFEESHEGFVIQLPEPRTFTSQHNHLRITTLVMQLDI